MLSTVFTAPAVSPAPDLETPLSRAETARLLLEVTIAHLCRAPAFDNPSWERWAAHGDETHALVDALAAVLRELRAALELEAEKIAADRALARSATRPPPAPSPAL